MGFLLSSTTLTLVLGILIGFAVASRSADAQGPAKLNGTFTHVGLIVPNVEKASRDFAEIFGLEPKTPREFTAMVCPKDFTGDPKAHPKTVTR